jgi:predicted mannosyl-3-phosphoglycerate phosphatase (HAD superfamily)
MDILRNRRIKNNDAVMFDIDDTLIFSNGKANTPIIKLLHGAMQLGYNIIIMTARPQIFGMLQMTKHQLSMYGIPYHELYITPATNKGHLKVKTGYNYVLSVGDADTDLTHTEYALKIST